MAARSSTIPILAGTAAMVVTTMPVLVAGVFAGEMRRDLGLSLAGLGVAVGVFKVTGALFAPTLGWIADRVPTNVAMTATLLLSSLSSWCLARWVGSSRDLAAGLALSGAGAAAAQLLAVVMLAQRAEARSHGVGIAVQVSALPVAAAASGVLLPILGDGAWRPAYLAHASAAALLAVAMLWASRGMRRRPPRPRPPRPTRPQRLTALAVMFGCAMVAASPLPIFIVETARAAGYSRGAASALLAIGSGGAISARLIAGRLADRGVVRPLPAATVMIACGAVGHAVLAIATGPMLAIGAAVAFVMGWGFVGLVFLAVVRLRPDTVGVSAGGLLRAGLIGGVAGPVLFGVVAEWWGLTWAWGATAGAALVAACAGMASLQLERRRLSEIP